MLTAEKQNSGTAAHSWQKKTLTSLLLTENGTFYSFGFDAEQKYMELVENHAERGWRFFKQFKMTLFENENLNREFAVVDDQGRPMQAEVVFGFAIEFLKNKALKNIQAANADISEENIYYVITLPAIWDDKSRQFMLEAVNKAGIDLDQVVLAKEPEAAAIYCKARQLGLQKENKKLGVDIDFNFEKGSKFIVLDFGGGTTDIAVNEITENERLRLIRCASGGPWGGTNIDKEFVSLIQDLVGGSYNLLSIIERNKDEYLTLLRNWELKKRMVSENGDDEEKIVIEVPIAFLPIGTPSDTREFQTKRGPITVNFKKMKIILSKKIFKALFETTVKNITHHLREIAEDTDDISAVFMVGVFSQSQPIQEAVTKAFPNKMIIIPHSPVTAVLRGAIIYGFNPDIIARRISSLHYGIEENGRFKVLVYRGQEIRIGEKIVEYRVNLKASEASRGIGIYTSGEMIPPDTTSSCKMLGRIKMFMSGKFGEIYKQLTIEIRFEHTEMCVEITEAETGKVFRATCDFLYKHTKD